LWSLWSHGKLPDQDRGQPKICESLHIPDRDQRLIVYSAAPGSPGCAALDLIRVVGNQSFATR